MATKVTRALYGVFITFGMVQSYRLGKTYPICYLWNALESLRILLNRRILQDMSGLQNLLGLCQYIYLRSFYRKAGNVLQIVPDCMTSTPCPGTMVASPVRQHLRQCDRRNFNPAHALIAGLRKVQSDPSRSNLAFLPMGVLVKIAEKLSKNTTIFIYPGIWISISL